jgi:hypothetical protein
LLALDLLVLVFELDELFFDPPELVLDLAMAYSPFRPAQPPSGNNGSKPVA